jgi:hypothetical protein
MIVARTPLRGRVWALFSIAVLAFLQATAALAVSEEALRIINRPKRLDEEKAAHQPKPADLSELFQPKRPFKDSYPTLQVQSPSGMQPASMFWMDNRYLLVGFQPTPSPSRISDSVGDAVIFILDSSNGQLHEYKRGQLECYRLGRVAYGVGRNLAFIRPGEREAFLWEGELGREEAVPAWAPDRSGKLRRNTVRPIDCTVMDPEFGIRRAKELGGVFYPEPRKEETPVWSTQPLAYPEHGFFAHHLPTLRSMSVIEADAYVGIWWFRPSGDRLLLNLHRFYEIGPGLLVDVWIPWLGRYVFMGRGVTYSLSPQASITSWTKTAQDFGAKGNVVVFDPMTGEVIKTPRPQALLHEAQVFQVAAVRAGILWSNNERPWGLFLSRGEEARKVSNRRLQNRPLRVSPDGCKAAVRFDPDNGYQTRNTARLEIVDFCEGDRP